MLWHIGIRTTVLLLQYHNKAATHKYRVFTQLLDMYEKRQGNNNNVTVQNVFHVRNNIICSKNTEQLQHCIS